MSREKIYYGSAEKWLGCLEKPNVYYWNVKRIVIVKHGPETGERPPSGKTTSSVYLDLKGGPQVKKKELGMR